MPTPTAITDAKPALVTVGTTVSYLEIEADREYRLRHMGIDSNGDPGAETIFIADASLSPTLDPTADVSDADNKMLLRDGDVEGIGPGIARLALKTAADSAKFSIVPCARFNGNF